MLAWESDRDKMREWLESAGIEMPAKIEDARTIDRPVLVKYHGAKGGRGFFIAKDYPEFKMGIDMSQPYTIQEYILGTRYYLHFFHSPMKQDGYKAGDGTLELLSMDRRDESNIDELYKLGASEQLKRLGTYPDLRRHWQRPGGHPGIAPAQGVRDGRDGRQAFQGAVRRHDRAVLPGDASSPTKLKFKVFEISSRIVAGSNPFVSGSPYSDLIEPEMSHRQKDLARDLPGRGKGHAAQDPLMSFHLILVDAEIEWLPPEIVTGPAPRICCMPGADRQRIRILESYLHRDLMASMPDRHRRGRPDIAPCLPDSGPGLRAMGRREH